MKSFFWEVNQMFSLADLDPRTKMVMTAAVSMAAMAVKNIWMLAGLLLFLFLLLAAGKVDFGTQLRQLKMAVGMVLFLFVLQTVFGQLQLGAVLCIRLLIVILSALILLTGEARDYLLGLVQWKVPYEIAYMVMIGLHFFPVLKEEAQDVYYSVQLRGMELKKTSLKNKIQTYLRICLPILAGAMERAKDMAVSMEARAFRACRTRTYLRRLHLQVRDYVVMILFVLGAAFFIFAGSGGFSHKIGMPSQILLSQTGEPQASQAVSWYGKEDYDGVVRFGTGAWEEEAAAERVEVRPGAYYRYKAVMKGLEPGTRYFYQVGDGRTWSEKEMFTTAGTGKQVCCLYMGDIQYQKRDEDYVVWGRLLKRACARDPQIRFGIFGGDMVERSGDPEDWASFFTQSQPVFSRISMATVPGNHETSVLPYTYMQMFPIPEESPFPGEVYSFDYGSGHFLMLNSCLFMEERIRDMGRKRWRAKMYELEQWMRQDLKESSGQWKVVVLHHPPYPVSEEDAIYGKIRRRWVRIWEGGKADLVLCGHQHLYMRTREIEGITYMMGNAGEKRSYYYQEGQVPSYVKKVVNATGTYQVLRISEGCLAVEAFDRSGKRIDFWKKER